MHTFYESVGLDTGSLPAVASGAAPVVTGATLDLQDSEVGAVVYCIGNSGDTLSGTVYLTITLEESDDDSTYTAVAAADIKGIVDHAANTVVTGAASIVIDDPAEDSRLITFEYGGSKRYLQGVITGTGTHTVGIPLAVVNVNARPKVAPVV